MTKGRMEAFSDGVFAIIITIMVLELKVPDGGHVTDLRPMLHVFLSYVLSFTFLGIYWNNHHHLLQAVERVDGRTLWANLHLLFWLSLIPAVTAWVGDSRFASWPVALYGTVLLFSACAFFILARLFVAHHGKESTLAIALGSDDKAKISLATYAVAVPLSFVSSWIACALYVLVAVMWLVPDPRIEKALAK